MADVLFDPRHLSVRDLLDSMMKGYPIGYFIFWESPDDSGEKVSHIGTDSKEYRVPRELVIDGQQRLTALVSALYGVEVKDKEFRSRRIRIAYNPMSAEFHTWDAAVQKNAAYIPDISLLFKASRDQKMPVFRAEYIKPMNEANEKRGSEPLTPEQQVEVENGMNALLLLENYPLPTLVIGRKADEEQVSDIFARVNSGGQRLNEDDFIMTLLSVYEPEMRKRIERFCEDSHKPAPKTSYNPLLTVKASHIVRATVGLGFRRGRLRYALLILHGRDLKTRETSEEIRRDNFQTFGDALDKVLNLNDWKAFINDLADAGYIRSDLVSSENAIPFTYTFCLIGKHRFKLDALTLRRIIKKWFFMATLTSLYAGSFESAFEQELRNVDELKSGEEFVGYLEDEIAARLTEDFFRVTLPADFDRNRASGPSWNAFVASQIVLGSKMMFTTTPIQQIFSMGADGTKKAYDRHHVFPKHYLEESSLDGLKDRRANFVCLDYSNNIDIGDDSPEDYVPAYRKQLGEEGYRESCEQNALPLGFETMGYEEFLSKPHPDGKTHQGGVWTALGEPFNDLVLFNDLRRGCRFWVQLRQEHTAAVPHGALLFVRQNAEKPRNHAVSGLITLTRFVSKIGTCWIQPRVLVRYSSTLVRLPQSVSGALMASCVLFCN